MSKIDVANFYKNKKVFVTGHTGFKGSWLVCFLLNAGAQITGYALEPEPNGMFEALGLSTKINSIIGDIRDAKKIEEALLNSEAEIVFHLAAQPIVRESYVNPAYTYDVNVMGTVNSLEAIRKSETVKSVVNVTTDKVYENNENLAGYIETDRLDGFEPYANSKSCSELITACYKRSFFAHQIPKLAVSTARAGNVIGGGDFAKDRIVPDCVRTALHQTDNANIVLRNPSSIRPYQHVLEPLYAYLLIAMHQYLNADLQGTYNIGPNEEDCITTEKLADIFCKKWGQDIKYECESAKKSEPHEAGRLVLNAKKIQQVFGYSPTWNIEKAIEETVLWTKEYVNAQTNNSADYIYRYTCNQIYLYLEG